MTPPNPSPQPPSHPLFRPNTTAIITGGASGIGLSIAALCLAHGLRVALLDHNLTNLHHASRWLAGQPHAHPDAVRIFLIDVGVAQAWPLVKMQIRDLQRWGQQQQMAVGAQQQTAAGTQHQTAARAIVSGSKSESESRSGSGNGSGSGWGPISLVFLNAGAAKKPTGTGWDDTKWWTDVMQTNLFGVTNGIATFLPELQPRTERSAIVITGSKQGITNPPGNAAYNASKAAVRSVAESLSLSLASSHPQIGVHLLVPGWTHTELTAGPPPSQTSHTGLTAGVSPGGLGPKPAGAWSADEVAAYMAAAMARGEFYIVCPDNETTEAMDWRRMRWGVEDLVLRRPPLTRWRGEWGGAVRDWMAREEAAGR